MLLYVFDMFHILLSGDSLRDLWNVYMYVCTSQKVLPAALGPGFDSASNRNEYRI